MNTSLRSGFVNQLFLFTILGLGVSGGVGVGAVWMQRQISIAANDNRMLEARIAAVERESEQLTTEIAEEQDPVALLKRNSDWRLGLTVPAQDHVINVEGDPIRRFARKQSSDGLLVGPLGR